MGRSPTTRTSRSSRRFPGAAPGTTCPPPTPPPSSSTSRRSPGSSCWGGVCGEGAAARSSESCSHSPGRRVHTPPSRWSRTPTMRSSRSTLVVALLCLTSPISRGIALALSGLTKFAPLALGPLFATYGATEGGPEGWLRRYAKVLIPVHDRVRDHGRRRLLPGAPGPGPLDLLAPHHRRAGRPRFALQHLGAGPFAGLAAGRRQGGGRRASRCWSPSGRGGVTTSPSLRSARR